ncbi:MAG TPA: histidine kinase dimerization/phospho-acceptor domain-containing protein [Candidatus Acidoferrales bacterium]|nr:histidine kinase dimerization/phospho-acceptor domain-containing protein [Candidatus Acidoferrales bacterium]
MNEVAEVLTEDPSIHGKNSQVLVGMPSGRERDQLVRRICETGALWEIATTSVFTELESRAARDLPGVIVFSESMVRPGVPLAEATHRLTVFAPVVVLASSERQSDMVGLVVSGEVDFVTFASEFASVAAAFVERRLHWPHGYSREFRAAWAADTPSDFAEILRHEINNPLTGILGNAELLLAQLRDKLPPLSVQRLETVVDLAVRLREKVRRLAAEPKDCESHAHSA